MRLGSFSHATACAQEAGAFVDSEAGSLSQLSKTGLISSGMPGRAWGSFQVLWSSARRASSSGLILNSLQTRWPTSFQLVAIGPSASLRSASFEFLVLS